MRNPLTSHRGPLLAMLLVLLRVRTGRFSLGELAPGQWRELTAAERAAVFA